MKTALAACFLLIACTTFAFAVVQFQLIERRVHLPMTNVEKVTAWLLAILWLSPLLYAFWAAFMQSFTHADIK
jgi:hypothetical protein